MEAAVAGALLVGDLDPLLAILVLVAQGIGSGVRQDRRQPWVVGDAVVAAGLHQDLHQREPHAARPFVEIVLAGDDGLAAIVAGNRDRKSTRLNYSHSCASRMPSSA